MDVPLVTYLTRPRLSAKKTFLHHQKATDFLLCQDEHGVDSVRPPATRCGSVLEADMAGNVALPAAAGVNAGRRPELNLPGRGRREGALLWRCARRCVSGRMCRCQARCRL